MSNSKPESGAGKTPAEVDPELVETTTPTTEGTQVLPDSADDVLVLLPDGTDGEVPVVETESVDEDLASSQTEMVDTSLEDVPLKRANPLMHDIPADPPPAEQSAGFEDLAAESDEDLFGTEQPVEKPSRPQSRRAVDRPRAVPEFFPAAAAGSTGSRRSWKLPIGLAAAVLLGAGGYVSYPQWRHFIDEAQVAIAAPRPGGATGVTDPSKTPRGTGSPSGKTKAVSSDLVRASRDAFREKFLLSVELGYVGEVSNE